MFVAGMFECINFHVLKLEIFMYPDIQSWMFQEVGMFIYLDVCMKNLKILDV